MVKTTARNSYLPGTAEPCQVMNNANRVHNWNSRRLHSTIITPFPILLMVSRRTLDELDVADPLENMWRWKEAYRHPRFPLKVSGVMTSTYFQTLIKFDKVLSTSITRGKHRTTWPHYELRNLVSDPNVNTKWTVTTRSSQLTKRDERIRWCQDFDQPTTIPFHNFSTSGRWITKRSADKKFTDRWWVPRPLAATHD